MKLTSSLGQRLLWLFASVFALSVVATLCVRQLLINQVDSGRSERVMQDRTVAAGNAGAAFDRFDAELLPKLDDAVRNAGGDHQPAIIAGGDTSIALLRASLATANTALKQSVDQLHATDPLLSGLLERCGKEYAAHYDRAITRLEQHDISAAAAEQILLSEARRREIGELDAYAGLVGRQLAGSASGSLADDTRARHLANRIVFVVVIAWLGVGLIFVWTVGIPLRRIMQTVRTLEGGVDGALLRRRDEIGEIAAMLARLHESMARLNRLAYHDPITKLPNRARFDEAVATEMQRAHRVNGAFALLFIDLNHFKSVNDGFGYAFGDRYLGAVAERLRRVTAEDLLLCRYSGDKFAVLLKFEARSDSNRLSLYTEASAVANGLLRAMTEPLNLESHSLTPFVSIGVALYPRDGADSDTLLTAADGALHAAKLSQDGICFASRGASDRVRSTMVLAGDIRRGLDAGEFRPYYQPVVNVDTGAVVGVESLIRWAHPSEGLLLPDRFLSVAQDTGLFEMITDVVLEKACNDAVVWRASGLDLRVAVNLTAQQLRPAVVERIRLQLAKAGLPPTAIEIEIVETAVMERPDEAAALLGQLRALGISISLDDFGTGYSSLSYLQRLPLDKIKIPHNFVGNLGKTREADEIVAATAAMAQSLGLALVAEGVDNLDQMRRLRALRCPLQQGFLFARAMPFEEIEDWMRLSAPRLVAQIGRAA